jgi:MOSC domain-containing protein YiiM
MHQSVMPANAGISSIEPEGSPQGDPGSRRGDDRMGVLGGIARHPRPKAACELVDHAAVTLEGGIAGDYRGAMKGKPYRRQVTLIERGDWDAALAEVGADIPWQERRSNLLIDGFDLPQTRGVRLRIGTDVVLEVTRETDPCERMEMLAPGLRRALLPDWRGGVCAMVIQGGKIAVGDTIRIEI